MNNKGQTIFIAFMIGVVCFVLGMALSSPLKQVLNEHMDTLACSQPDTLTTQQRTVCTSIDLFLPLFTGIIFGIGGILLGSILVK